MKSFNRDIFIKEKSGNFGVEVNLFEKMYTIFNANSCINSVFILLFKAKFTTASDKNISSKISFDYWSKIY